MVRTIFLTLALLLSSKAAISQNIDWARANGVSSHRSIDRNLVDTVTRVHSYRYILLPNGGIRVISYEAADGDTINSVTEYDKANRVTYDSDFAVRHHLAYVTDANAGITYALDTLITVPPLLPDWARFRVRGGASTLPRPDTVVNITINYLDGHDSISKDTSNSFKLTVDSNRRISVRTSYVAGSLKEVMMTAWDSKGRTTETLQTDYKAGKPDRHYDWTFQYTSHHDLGTEICYTSHDTFAIVHSDHNNITNCLTEYHWSKRAGYETSVTCYDTKRRVISDQREGHKSAFIRTQRPDGKEDITRTYRDGKLIREQIDQYSYDLYKK